ncbi:hypothetical protein E4U42_002109, partial [Claviceps africana]
MRLSRILPPGLVLLFAQHTATASAAPTNPILPIAYGPAANMIPNRYIVVYNSSFSGPAIDATMSLFSAAVRKRNLHRRGLGGRRLSTAVVPLRMNAWRAMALDADDAMIADINRADEVAYVEADRWIDASATVAQADAPLGLRRLSGKHPGRAPYLFDESAGEGVTVYVVDTG